MLIILLVLAVPFVAFVLLPLIGNFADTHSEVSMLDRPTFTLPKGSPTPDLPARFADLNMSVSALANLLRSTATAHHAHELATGTPDPHWADWYAAYMATHASAYVHPFIPAGGSHDR